MRRSQGDVTEPKTGGGMLYENYQRNPLIAHRFFYTLPGSLLKLLFKEKLLDPELVDLEIELSAICGDHSGMVGFHDGNPIAFAFLRKSEFGVPSVVEAFERNLPTHKIKASLKLAEERLDHSRRSLRAYLGWLLTNPVFLTEQAALWTAIAPKSGECEATRKTKSVEADQPLLERYCARWRLINLLGPFLPVPIGTQFPALAPQISIQNSRSSGYGLAAIPDTQSLPSAEELRSHLEEIRMASTPEHLREWFAIEGASNPSKNLLARYARVFEVQHYWRVVHLRHSNALHRRQGRLMASLASFLNVSGDAIQRDANLIKERLGHNQWWDRFPWPAV